MSLQNRVKSAVGGLWDLAGVSRTPSPFSSTAVDQNKNIYKAVIPKFLYKPPYGYPRFVDVPELRRLASTPFVEMCVNTIVDEVSNHEWEIVPRSKDRPVSNALIKDTTDFFDNPNINKESFDSILRKTLRDILTLDSGVMVKVFDGFQDFREIYARDGGTFTKNPDKFGTFSNRADIIPVDFMENMNNREQLNDYMTNKPAYFQYGWITGARPMPFGKREVVYLMRNPRPDSIYGRAPMEVLSDVVQMLVYGIDQNLEYYTDNNIPKGVFNMMGADSDAIKSFKQQWRDITQKKNEVGDWRRSFYKMPIINTEGKFQRLQFSNAELELIGQQEWFSKVVWALYGVTPSELGFTQDSNRATEVVQSGLFRRRTILPLLNLLEFHINNELVWSEFSPEVEFQFDRYDLQEDLKKHGLYEIQLRTGIRTVNEIRDEQGLEPVEGGDTSKVNQPVFNMFKQDGKYPEDIDKQKPKEEPEEKTLNLWTKNYLEGVRKAEKELDVNIDFKMNPRINHSHILKAINTGVSLVTDLTEEQRTQLKNILLSVLERPRSMEDLKHEITEELGLEETKASAIVRTESTRIQNAGQLDAYEAQEIPMKKWMSVLDARTSPLCKELHNKYNGNPIPLDQPFTATVKQGKKTIKWSGLYPPAHVNCRSMMTGAIKEEF